jgi:hypothetical protein
MRAHEFITEASIFTKPDIYSYGHKINIAVGGRKGQGLLAKIKEQMPDFDPNEVLVWVPIPDDNYPEDIPEINLGRENSSNTRYFKRSNGEIFSVSGPDKSIQGCLTHAEGEKGSTAKNKGDASEPVLSAAVVAKLIKRGANNVEDITGDDVKHVLTQALEHPSLTYTVTDKNSKVADIIKFTIKVKEPTRKNLAQPGFWEGYGNLLESTVHYANSGHMDRYADYFYKNGKVDIISVTSDGVSDAKTRKTDIDAYVKDDHGVVRKLKGLNISLKAGSAYIGQVGAGSSDTNDSRYMLSNAQNLFGPLGIEIKKSDSINNRLEFWVDAYKQAETQLKTLLGGKNSKKEAGVVFRLANFIKSHATNNDPTIHIVSLDKKGLSTIHGFSGIEHKLVAKNIDLDCKLRMGASRKKGDPRPEITIFDKTSNEPLVKIRYSSTEAEDKAYSGVSMEKLLKKLTTITYNKDKSRVAGSTNLPNPSSQKAAPVAAQQQAPAQQQQAAQQAPVAAQQAPVAAQQQQAVQQQAPVAAQQQAAPVQTPKSKVDLSRSPLTAKWMST